MQLGIDGRRVLITGASQGIGAEIARCLSSEGAKCILLARNENNLRSTMAGLSGSGHSYYVIDLSNLLETRKLISELQEISPIEICIHNLGGTLGVKSHLAALQDWSDVWMFNVGISIEINNLIIPKMTESHYGRIVHISSISGESLRGSAPYGASKAYLNAYVKLLGRGVAQQNIVVSGVMPGAVYAEGGHWDENAPHNVDDKEGFFRKRADFLRHHHAIGRLGVASEIAPWVTFLCSDQASFANGCLIPIDGGTM